MRVLGIETSCDDTGAAIYGSKPGLIAHQLASQIALHQPYGGVVPELAARDHIRSLTPLIDALIADPANKGQRPDAIAYTQGPGLTGALLVGASVARSLAYAWNLPAIGVHHMEGHLLAPMLEADAPEPPFVALLVSGGHSMMVDVNAIGSYTILGQSLDDAAGEAFDKTAKMLGLAYPGGPEIARVARSGHAGRFEFPRPMTDRPGLDMSFSGLKTFTLTTAQKLAKASGTLSEQDVADIAHAFEQAVTDTLAIKCARAIEATGHQRLVIAGGVGANQVLREKVASKMAEVGVRTYYPQPAFCTDNGAMIAYAGWLRLTALKTSGRLTTQRSFNVKARWPLDSLPMLGETA